MRNRAAYDRSQPFATFWAAASNLYNPLKNVGNTQVYSVSQLKNVISLAQAAQNDLQTNAKQYYRTPPTPGRMGDQPRIISDVEITWIYQMKSALEDILGWAQEAGLTSN